MLGCTERGPEYCMRTLACHRRISRHELRSLQGLHLRSEVVSAIGGLTSGALIS